MMGIGKGKLAGLVALKLVCCGGLLLGFGVISLGSLLAFVDQPAVQIGGGTLVVGSVVWWGIAVRNNKKAVRRRSPEESREGAGYPLCD